MCVPFQRLLEKLAGVGAWVAGDLLRRAGNDNFTTTGAAFRAEVDDPVGGLDDIQVVLDDDDGVAVIAQPVQHRQ